MMLLWLAVRNLTRNKVRTSLTLFGVVLLVVAFLLLRTLIWAWAVGVEAASKDRVVTRNKITFIMPLPHRYVDDVKQMPGVKKVTFASWFGGKDPKHNREFFGTLAVDDESFFDVYDDMFVAPDVRQRWMEDRKGAIVGDVLAKKLGWKIGDTITLAGTIYPGEWQYHVTGFYEARTKAVDRSTFLFHWSYLNDSLKRQSAKDRVGWIVSRVSDPAHSADIGVAIDKVFDARDTQTLSQDERSFNASFLGGISAILTAIDVVSFVLLLIMALILGNTIAMGVRERTGEYGVLLAIGFLPVHVVQCVLTEALAVGLVGGGLGVAISYPFIEKVVGRILEENVGQFFPYFRVPSSMAAAAIALAVVLSVAAALVPAYRVWRLNVVQALRRIG